MGRNIATWGLTVKVGVVKLVGHNMPEITIEAELERLIALWRDRASKSWYTNYERAAYRKTAFELDELIGELKKSGHL